MQSVQDDNACPAAPIPGNGVRISFDVLLRELEKRNYALDQDAYALGQSEFLVQSIGEHLGKIRDRGLQDTYFGYMQPYKIGTRGMYGNPRPGYLPSVETIEDMELKTIVFERLVIENIVSIASDGRENFTAVDVDGVCYRFAAADSEAVRAYREFLAGERSVGLYEDINWLITPTGEPDRRYTTWYCIWDVDGDGTPELHVLSGRDYRLYSYNDGEMFYFDGFFSRPWRNVPLENGAFIETYDTGTTLGGYYYFEKEERKTVSERRFYWTDTNENFVCDEEDVFWYEGENYTMEEWFARTGQYIMLTKDGRTRVRNSVAWTVYCEEIW